jgi:hypothetical protein
MLAFIQLHNIMKTSIRTELPAVHHIVDILNFCYIPKHFRVFYLIFFIYY